MSREDLKKDLQEAKHWNESKKKKEMFEFLEKTKKDFQDFRDIKRGKKFSVYMGR